MQPGLTRRFSSPESPPVFLHLVDSIYLYISPSVSEKKREKKPSIKSHSGENNQQGEPDT